ncbi:WD40 repeat protein [Kribbella antiqua]|uniref:WD40 repeat protein n=1 Tax=Kribbella antiqua TaxID=2512217 RepID=A0A4R2IZ54_9ACTN|nr:PD40 domain-containing protein [Kribbella antiqua]TCO50272.1 WD40 repeat protein [Kribbella antiqua]
MSWRSRIAIVVATTVVLAAVAIGYIRLAADRATGDTAEAVTSDRVTLSPGPRLLVVSNRHLTTVSRDDPGGPRTAAPLECVRVYAAAGTGACIRPDSAWSYHLVVLDQELHEKRSIAIRGLPNRARVSASGRMVAWTSFVGGDSYNHGGFSTRTGVLDTRTGALVTTLEKFAVTRQGRPYQAADLNFWGVTFTADDNRFYATMATAGRRYLVEGDFAARTVRTLKENVECPSLSPDGTRIAFKEAIGADPTRGWRLSVLALDSMRVTALAERRSIDDQAAWLDNTTLAYTVRDSSGDPDVWSVPADGSGAPRLLIPDADSPAALG